MIIRITSSDDGGYVEGCIPDDSTYEDVADLVDGLLVAFGFPPETVIEYRG